MTQEPWVAGLTFPEALQRVYARVGDREILVYPKLGIRWGYGEFLERVDGLARALIASGVKPGAHVGIWATSWPEWVLNQFATARIGAVQVNVNPAYTAKECGFVLKQADIDTLLVTDAFSATDYEAVMGKLVPELKTTPYGDPLVSENFPKLRHVVSIKNAPSLPGIWPWEEFLSRGSACSQEELDAAMPTDPELPVNIQFTSGTTGAPKGAMLSHRNLLYNAYYTGERLQLGDDDRVCNPFPYYHCAGCVCGTLTCMLYGATMVTPNEHFDPEATLAAASEEKCTVLHGVPTMFNAEVHHPNFDQYTIVADRGVIGGSPCPVELMKILDEKVGMKRLTAVYGLTEASPVITLCNADEPAEDRLRSVGHPIPGVAVRIVDPATMTDVSEGAQGELWTKGHNVMLGYYKRPDATAEAIVEEGWLRTGDLATKLASGCYHITGRSKDLIIRGGENVYPREVEEHLLTHPGVQDVQIVGLPDALFGEQVSAWVVRSDTALTEEQVRAYCKEHLAHFKVPKYVVFVDSYPLTVSGKVQKFRLRELGVVQFELEAAAAQETL